jgi:hypothetical protein
VLTAADLVFAGKPLDPQVVKFVIEANVAGVSSSRISAIRLSVKQVVPVAAAEAALRPAATAAPAVSRPVKELVYADGSAPGPQAALAALAVSAGAGSALATGAPQELDLASAASAISTNSSHAGSPQDLLSILSQVPKGAPAGAPPANASSNYLPIVRGEHVQLDIEAASVALGLPGGTPALHDLSVYNYPYHGGCRFDEVGVYAGDSVATLVKVATKRLPPPPPAGSGSACSAPLTWRAQACRPTPPWCA